MNQLRVTICGSGLKAAHFLENILAQKIALHAVVSYSQAQDKSHSFEKIQKICLASSIPLTENRSPKFSDFSGADIVFIIGWQFLLASRDERFIVFHDSILPRYRGFTPTVTALINGDSEIGVSAFIPVSQVDSGPVVAQRKATITHPMRIENALITQAELMVDIAVDIVERRRAVPITGKPQDNSAATYSIWRDEEDYWIDWTKSSDEIQRFIYATGYPYEGARTRLGEQEVIITECMPVDDLDFVFREPGKIWSINAGMPSVICGTGILKILKMRDSQGNPAEATRLRQRFRGMPPR